MAEAKESQSRPDDGWGPIKTVADLIRNLQTLPPDAGFHTVYFVEIDGKRVAKAHAPSMSWETIALDGYHVEKYDPSRRSVVMWVRQEAPRSERGRMGDRRFGPEDRRTFADRRAIESKEGDPARRMLKRRGVRPYGNRGRRTSDPAASDFPDNGSRPGERPDSSKEKR